MRGLALSHPWGLVYLMHLPLLLASLHMFDLRDEPDLVERIIFLMGMLAGVVAGFTLGSCVLKIEQVLPLACVVACGALLFAAIAMVVAKRCLPFLSDEKPEPRTVRRFR